MHAHMLLVFKNFKAAEKLHKQFIEYSRLTNKYFVSGATDIVTVHP